MPTKIQRITIDDSQSQIELIIADEATPDNATTWLQLRVPCQVKHNHLLAEVLQSALNLGRAAIDTEITGLKSLQGRS